MSDFVYVNNDKEIWREVEGDYYSPSIHVHPSGKIGINVGGTVHVKDVRDWHNLAQEDWYGEEPTVDTSQASEQVIEMFANLARRVNSLERQLAATQRNLETFAEQTEDNSEDIRELDERTQPKENSEIDRLADFILKHYGHEIGLGNPQEGESAVDVAIRLLTPVAAPKESQWIIEAINKYHGGAR